MLDEDAPVVEHDGNNDLDYFDFDVVVSEVEYEWLQKCALFLCFFDCYIEHETMWQHFSIPIFCMLSLFFCYHMHI